MQTKDPTAVLVVDDDEAIREVVSDLLEDEGYAVFAVETHAEARAVVARETISLVLLDTTDRGALLATELPFTGPRPPVVLFSAAEGLAERAAAMRVEGFLAKPFAVDDLIALVARYARA